MTRHELHLLKREARKYYRLAMENIDNRELHLYYCKMLESIDAKIESVTNSYK